MKKFSLYPFAIAASLFVLAACSDDDDKNEPGTTPEPELPFGPTQNYTYTDGAGLAMTYNGEPLIGKAVSITANTGNPANPTITLTGAPFDLSQIMGDAAPSLAGRATENTNTMAIPTPGVLPGTPEVSFPITLSEDGTFSGEGNTAYCSYKYAGTWNEKDGIALQFSDVTLTDQTLAGTSWELLRVPNEDYDEEQGEDDNYNPKWYYKGIYINWETTTDLDLEGWKLPISSVIELALAMTQVEVGENSVSVQKALSMVLTDISFTNDGNIIATYLDEETGEYAVSPKNMAQYVIDNGVLKLFLNPQAILMSAAADQTSRADEGAGIDVEAIMSSLMALMQNYAPYVSTGFPLGINNTEGGMTLYLGTEFMMPLMNAASAIITQPAILEMIKQAVAQDPVMGSMSEMVGVMLTQLPGILETTKKFEIGLNLMRK